MRGVSRIGAAAAVVLAAVLNGAPLGAQTLDLGPASEPALPAQSFLPLLSARLEADLAKQRDRLANARDAGDEDWVLATSVSVVTRALALRMLGADPSMPDAREVRVVIAATIAELAPSVDALADAYVDLAFQTRGAEAPDTASIEMAARVEAARAAFGALLRAAADDPGSPEMVRSIPTTVPGLDRFLLEIFDELRPAIEAVVGDGVEIAPAWPAPGGAEPPVDAIERAREALGAATLGEGVADEIGALLDRLDEAQGSPVQRRAARSAGVTIGEALRAGEVIAGTEWLDERRSEAPGVAGEACVALLSRTTRLDAERTAGALTRLGALVERIEALEARRVQTRAAKRAADLLLGGVLPAPREPRPGAPARLDGMRLDDALGAVDRVLAVASERPVLDPGHFEDQMLRRAWRLMERDYEQAERRALDALPALASEPARLASPDVVSLLKAHRDAKEDLRRVASIPVWVGQLRAPEAPDPGAGSAGGLGESSAIDESIRSGAADRLAALGDALSRDNVRSLVLIELATFERSWGRFAELPGEAMLRRGLPAATAATGGRSAEILGVFRRERREWLVAWAAWRLDDVQKAIERLERLAGVGRAIEACVLLSDPERLDAIDRWAALEVRDGVGVVRRDAKEKLDMMLDGVLAGDWGGVDLALDAWGRRAGAADLLAHVARASDGEGWPREEGVRGLVARLGSGAPAGSWLIEERRRLGVFTRWMGELAVAEAAGTEEGDELAWAILQYLHGQTRPVLEALEGE